MADGHALLFIPDISGFSRFVQTTEVEHSRHIIAELLELLIDSNEIGLKLAEIEGDALFFYMDGALPSRQAVLQQAEKMFLRFHEHLLAYKYRRICRCGACTTATDLNLKFVIHSGEIGFIEVKETRKPFGHHVVLAHRLLKNKVDIHEYALFSDDAMAELHSDPSISLRLTDPPAPGKATYDVGDLSYQYYSLSSLQGVIEAPVLNDPGERIAKPWTLSMDINAPIEEVYDVVSNFDRRLEWNIGLTDFEYRKGEINRVGTEHKCIVNNKHINFDTITADFGGRLVYGERTREVPLVDLLNTYFIFEPLSKDHTRLTIEVHPVAQTLVKKVMVPLLKIIAWKNIQKQFALIKSTAESSS